MTTASGKTYVSETLIVDLLVQHKQQIEDLNTIIEQSTDGIVLADECGVRAD